MENTSTSFSKRPFDSDVVLYGGAEHDDDGKKVDAKRVKAAEDILETLAWATIQDGEFAGNDAARLLDRQDRGELLAKYDYNVLRALSGLQDLEREELAALWQKMKSQLSKGEPELSA